MGRVVSIDEILPRHPISLVAMDSFAPFRGGNGSGSHVDLSCALARSVPARVAPTARGQRAAGSQHPRCIFPASRELALRGVLC
jgi:hypothetical protein